MLKSSIYSSIHGDSTTILSRLQSRFECLRISLTVPRSVKSRATRGWSARCISWRDSRCRHGMISPTSFASASVDRGAPGIHDTWTWSLHKQALVATCSRCRSFSSTPMTSRTNLRFSGSSFSSGSSDVTSLKGRSIPLSCSVDTWLSSSTSCLAAMPGSHLSD